VADLKQTIEATDSPKCGFNPDGNSYCSVRKGDSYFKAYLKVTSDIFSKLQISCNPATSGMCKGVLD